MIGKFCSFFSLSRFVKRAGVDFINILCAQITKAQKDSKVVSLFCAFGKYSIKAVHKKLMKLTTGDDFINILCAPFL